MNSHFSAPGLCLLFVFLSLKALAISDIEQKQLVENYSPANVSECARVEKNTSKIILQKAATQVFENASYLPNRYLTNFFSQNTYYYYRFNHYLAFLVNQ